MGIVQTQGGPRGADSRRTVRGSVTGAGSGTGAAATDAVTVETSDGIARANSTGVALAGSAAMAGRFSVSSQSQPGAISAGGALQQRAAPGACIAQVTGQPSGIRWTWSGTRSEDHARRSAQQARKGPGIALIARVYDNLFPGDPFGDPAPPWHRSKIQAKCPERWRIESHLAAKIAPASIWICWPRRAR
jgi:hypothetical protein